MNQRIKRFISIHKVYVLFSGVYAGAVLVLTLSTTVYLYHPSIPTLLVMGSIPFEISFFIPQIVCMLFRTQRYKGKHATALIKVAHRCGITSKLYVRKAGSSNAFAASFWCNRAVIFNSYVLHTHPVDEIEAVMAHELGHHAHNDPLAITSVTSGALVMATVLAHRMNPQVPTVVSSIILTGCVLIPFLAFRRFQERRADRYAHQFLSDPRPFARFFTKIVSDARVKGITVSRHPSTIHKLVATHPPIFDRIHFFKG